MRRIWLYKRSEAGHVQQQFQNHGRIGVLAIFLAAISPASTWRRTSQQEKKQKVGQVSTSALAQSDAPKSPRLRLREAPSCLGEAPKLDKLTPDEEKQETESSQRNQLRRGSLYTGRLFARSPSSVSKTRSSPRSCQCGKKAGPPHRHTLGRKLKTVPVK